MPDPNYREVSIPSHKQGIEAYAIWFAQQPTEAQQLLLAQGLGPEAREGDGNYTFEVKADHQAYAYEDDLTTADEPVDAPRTYTEDEVQEVIRRVVMAMQLSESPDCLFQARCILIAFGIGDPPSETELAKQRECSRQFVSKKVKRIQQLFNLAPSQYMRSEAACKAYADAWQRNRDKKQAKQTKRPRKPTDTTQELPLTSIQMGLGSQSNSLLPAKPIKRSKGIKNAQNPPPVKESIIFNKGVAGS
jgi:hypothetical protein